jgi:hypothetical protein
MFVTSSLSGRANAVPCVRCTLRDVQILDEPKFLSISGYRVGHEVHEIVSRRRLDTRQIVPWFRDPAGVVHVGLLERSRASRVVRGASPVGLEPIGFDFSGVDETGDVRDYGRAIFSARAGLAVDEGALAIPLPSFARSIGYSTELALPLLLPIQPTDARAIDVSWDDGHHRIVFATLEEATARLENAHARNGCVAEDLAIALPALAPPRRQSFGDRTASRAFLSRARVLDARGLAAAVHAPVTEAPPRTGTLRGDQLRFLRLVREGDIEVVTPGSGISIAILPWVAIDDEPYFLLWSELRVSTLERRERQPIFDVPIHPRHINATARFARSSIVDSEAVEEALGAALGTSVRITALDSFGVAEPAPSFSSEVRHRVGCEIDPESLARLPDDAILVRGRELVAAVRDGVVRDPVIVAGLLSLGLDPFVEARRGEVGKRRAFLDTMTSGSIVQRRLESYSSIEAEQLGCVTYARVMLMLQHRFGVRIAYPKSETDRSFFKAAFRVFMASPRVAPSEKGEHELTEEDRAMQGLHWSHDAFHFALGNFTLPSPDAMGDDFARWYLSGDKLPESLPAEGPVWDGYHRALKTAEDEATFFSFWTLYEEQPSLKRYVGKLTYWEACRELGLLTREDARSVFDDVTTREFLPSRVSEHPVYQAREDVRSLFTYMLGFRAYHRKDIEAAWKHASRDVYRGTFLRFGIYESDVDRYVEGVRTFRARLAQQPPGLSPLLALAADVRVALALRVWDVVKAMKLLRPKADRRAVLDQAEIKLSELEALDRRLTELRARVGDAELSTANEETFAALQSLAAEVETEREAIWTWAATFGVLSPEVLAEERARELPR